MSERLCVKSSFISRQSREGNPSSDAIASCRLRWDNWKHIIVIPEHQTSNCHHPLARTQDPEDFCSAPTIIDESQIQQFLDEMANLQGQMDESTETY